jgi:hypothetical protein
MKLAKHVEINYPLMPLLVCKENSYLKKKKKKKKKEQQRNKKDRM